MKPTNEIKNVICEFGIIISLYFIPIALPFLGGLCAIFTPLPVFFYRMRLGGKISLITIGAISLFIFCISDNRFYSIIFLWLIILGFILSELTEAKFSLESVITKGAIYGSFIAFLFIFLYANAVDKGAIELTAGFVNKNLNIILTLYKEAGIPKSEIELFTASMGRLEFIIVRIMPGIILSGALLISVITTLTARGSFAKKIPLPHFGNPNCWRAEDNFVWYFIVSAVLILLPIRDWRLIGVNGLIVLFNIYFFQGWAIISYYLEKKKINKMVKPFLFVVVISIKYLLFALVAAGLFDTWFDFRKIRNKASVKESP
ncbi:MAG: DUF2232 domain-containing protein [Deltaproteobacteria bacterium]|nr:DUF2232 domain-containing protein [Deltaproteobacteria bacterium]